jgi:hypothetical protein
MPVMRKNYLPNVLKKTQSIKKDQKIPKVWLYQLKKETLTLQHFIDISLIKEKMIKLWKSVF